MKTRFGTLEFVPWNLVPIAIGMEFGICPLEFGICTLEFGPDSYRDGICNLYPGVWSR